MVVQRLLELMGLPTRFHRCPIVREPDGLAMSSRNMRLNPAERANATAIYHALLSTRANNFRDRTQLQPLAEAAETILEKGCISESITSRSPMQPRLEPVSDPTSAAEIVALIAAFQGEVRLIDNMIL